MEEVNMPVSWNKKRIFIAIFLLALLMVGGYFFKPRILDENSSKPPAKSVQGTKAEEETVEPDIKTIIQEVVKEKINILKQEVSGLDVSEVASSSPQIQKILNDIKSLEQYPENQVKEICKQICGL